MLVNLLQAVKRATAWGVGVCMFPYQAFNNIPGPVLEVLQVNHAYNRVAEIYKPQFYEFET